MNEPPIGPVPRHEIAIGHNLRRWRLSQGIKISMPQIARAIGEKTDRINSYEKGRNPIAWGVAKKLWEELSLSPRFLATGTGPMLHPFPALKTLVPQADAMAKFPEVWASQLEADFAAQASRQLETALRSVENFAALARAGKVDAVAVLVVAETAHAQHEFPVSVRITSGAPGALTRNQKTALKAKAPPDAKG